MTFERSPSVTPYPTPDESASLLWKWPLIICAYYVAGRLGLSVPVIGDSITLIWMPTGIAVAALFKWGFRMWPAVWLGALLVNMSVGSSLATSIGIAIGNTLGPLWSAWLLREVGFQSNFDQRKDVAWLVAAAFSGTLLSASGGSLSLSLANEVEGQLLTSAWANWWMGDTVGVLLAAPLLLTLTRRNLAELSGKWLEILFFAIVLVAVDWFIFLPPFGRHALAFIPVFLTMWAALRYGITGSSVSVLVSSIVAAWGTASGFGPFHLLNPDDAMVMVWAYMTTLVVVSLVVTALLSDGRLAAAELRVQSRILHNLNEGVTLVRTSDLVIVYTNLTFDRMFGYESGELAGLHVSRVNASSDRTPQQKTKDIHEALLKHGAWEGEILNVKKDGTPFWSNVRISSFNHHELGPVWLSVHNDISTRKKVDDGSISLLAATR